MRGVAEILTVLFLAGCMSSHQTVISDVNALSWRDTTQLTLPNTDTVSLRDLAIFLCYNELFTADTLPLHITTLSPDSLCVTERVLLYIPHRHTPAALTREVGIPYRNRVRLSRMGNYQLLITPETPVQGIESIGIDIEKSK